MIFETFRIHSFKYQRSTTSSYKDTHFPFLKKNLISLIKPIYLSLLGLSWIRHESMMCIMYNAEFISKQTMLFLPTLPNFSVENLKLKSLNSTKMREFGPF